MQGLRLNPRLEVSISWGLEVLAPAHIVRGLENSQD